MIKPSFARYDELLPFGKCLIDTFVARQPEGIYYVDSPASQLLPTATRLRGLSPEAVLEYQDAEQRTRVENALQATLNLNDTVLMFVGIERLYANLKEIDAMDDRGTIHGRGDFTNPAYGVLSGCAATFSPSLPLSDLLIKPQIER